MAHTRVDSYHVPEGARVDPKTSGYLPGTDWAVLSLSADISELLGTIPVESGATGADAVIGAEDGSVVQVGYSQDKAHVLSAHQGCRILGRFKDTPCWPTTATQPREIPVPRSCGSSVPNSGS